jgi:putative SOS response-associated peptidase YedK
MCGRFSQLPIQLQPGIARALADAAPGLGEDLAGLRPRYNLAPTQLAGVIHDTEDGLLLDRLAWGLLPFWAKDAKVGYSTINARVETVATKPAFRSAFRERRALVPMAGYFEWTEPRPKFKQPWFVHLPGGEPLWAAALWEPRHRIHTGDEAGTFTVITTTARDAAGDVHDRMPVFLPIEDAAAWIREPAEAALERLANFAVPPVRVYPVSRRVNAPRDDDAGLLEPVVLEDAAG